MEQTKQLVIDETFPLWAIISSIIFCLGTACWTLIKMYFQSQTHNEKMEQLEKDILSVEETARLNLKNHKEETDKRVSQISDEIKSTRDILIEVKTMCKLLIGDRIKKSGE